MRLPEQKLWDDLRNSLGGGWFPRRIEDKLGGGLPDLSFTGRKRRCAWMELKVLPNLPAEGGIRKFDIAHFSAEQRGFGLEISRHGGQSAWWLMTRVGPIDHLHRANVIDMLGEVNYTTFRKRAVWFGDVTKPAAAQVILNILFT